MNPTLRQFAAFVQVARLGSFARASDALGLSQPALSQSIAQMEQLLGARLFTRTTRAVELTREGALLLPRAEAILAGVDEAVALVREHAGLARGRISLGALPSLAPVFLPDILRGFRRQHSSTRVAVTDGTSEVLYEGVESGKIDLAIGSRLPGRAAIAFTSLRREPFVLVLPRTHRLARKTRVTWAEALAEDFLAFPPGSAGHAAMEEGLQQAGLPLRPLMTFAQSITALNMVLSGAGVAALPLLGYPASHPKLTMRPLVEPAIDREIGLVAAAARDYSPALAALREIATHCIVTADLPGMEMPIRHAS